MLNHLEHEPKNWDEIVGQEANVKRARTWLQRNTLPTFLYIEGPSGCGKTVWTKNLIRATHCINREEGTSEPCGTCPICNSDPSESSINNNVIWVKSSFNAGATQQSTIKDALLQAEYGPTISNRVDTAHREILFVVFEEAQNISRDLLQRALAFGDVRNNVTSKVCLVFITMSPDDMHPTVNQALRQRGATCRFKRPSLAELKDFAKKIHPNIPDEIASLLADEAEGSYRGLLNSLKDALDLDSSLDPVNINMLFGCLSDAYRGQLWASLSSNISYTDLRDRLTSIFYYVSPAKLFKQMQKDLDEFFILGKLDEDYYLTRYKDFNTYLLNPNLFNPVNLIYKLRGIKLG